MIEPSLLSFFSLSIETLVTELLCYDPGTRIAIQKLNGNTLRAHLSDYNINVIIHFTDDKPIISIQPLATNEPNLDDEESDLLLTGRSGDFLKLLNTKNYSLADSGVVATGKVGLLDTLQAILTDVEIDWEDAIAEKLNKLVPNLLGNLIASPLSFTLKKAQRAASQSTRNTLNQINDFAQYESGLLVTKNEFQCFCNELIQVRQATERLEARIQQYLSQPSKPQQ